MDENLTEFRLEAENVDGFLHKKTVERYKYTYDQLMAWKDAKSIDKDNFTEDMLLAYFKLLKNKYKSSTLSVIYSMLKTTIVQQHNIDINYPKLNDFLKQCYLGYVPKKSNVFISEDIRRFLHEAPDTDFLALKIVLIFGIHGVTESKELTKVCLEHVNEQGRVLIVKVRKQSNQNICTFTLQNEYAIYVRKYMRVRPRHTQSSRFFLRYRKGKCSSQAMGRNAFLTAPKMIAKFLNLKDPNNYTGQSFRRTPVAVRTDPDANIMTLNGSVAKKESFANEQDIASQIESAVTSQSTVVHIAGSNTETTFNITELQADDIDGVTWINCDTDPLDSTSIGSDFNSCDTDQSNSGTNSDSIWQEIVKTETEENKDDLVRVDRLGPITIIGLNRSQERNAINQQMAFKICEAITNFENDNSSTAGVIHGVGCTFCSEYGIDDLQSEALKSENLVNSEGSVVPIRRIIKKPMVCAVSGDCIANGLELALMCDLRVVEDDAILGFFNRRYGIPSLDGGTARLPAMIGLSRALDLVLTGKMVPAKEAFEMGLANRIVKAGTALQESINLAQCIAKFPQASLNHDRNGIYSSAFETKSFSTSCMNDIISLESRVVATAVHTLKEVSNEEENQVISNHQSVRRISLRKDLTRK